MIEFKYVKWKNFLSTGNDWTRLELNQHNMTLVIGENGAGKSTMLDAITFVLYGKPFRKVNKGQLINSINNKECLVEIEFSIGTNDYRVKRGLKKNIFEIYKNNELIEQDTKVLDYQTQFEKTVLKLNFKSFCQVVILGSASFIPFMELKLSDRREIIEDILDLQIFTIMNSLLKKKMEVNNKEIVDVDYNIKLIEEKIILKEKHLEEMNTNHQEIIDDYKRRIKKNENMIFDNDLVIDEISEKISNLQNKTKDVNKIKKQLEEFRQIKTKIVTKRSNIEKEISFFNNNDVCPTCSRDIDKEFKDNRISVKNISIKELSDGLNKLENKLEDISKRNEEITNINNEITSLNTDSIIKTKYNKEINRNIQDLNKSLESIINKYSTTEGSKEEISSLENELNKSSKLKKNLHINKDIYSVCSIMLKDNGIKSKIISQYVPVINKLINKYLAELEFMVQFELDETFNETIKSRFRDEFSYASFSEGEKMRINLAILFTWRAIAKIRNSASTNLLILDEIFDGSLDAAGTEDFMKILNNLVKGVNAFIISHKGDQLHDKFEKVIKFEKVKQFSEIST